MSEETIDIVFYVATTLVKIIAFTHIALILAALMVLGERRISAFMQSRLGPNRVGWGGILQPIADALKFIFKEDVVPGHVDKPLYVLAPAIALIPTLLTIAVVPFGPSLTLFGREVPLVIADLDIGILWVFAIASLAVYGITLAGWASNSRYPLLGGVRASAQMISYELCLGLSVIGVFMATSSLRLLDVVAYQQEHGWFAFTQPLGFLIFVICAFAETNRLPFDTPEAETELVAGYHTEYSSMKFAMFFMGEYSAMFVFGALVATLFLGGWAIPFVSPEALAALGNWGALLGFISFMVKCVAFLFFYIWVRWTIPRFRFDQTMDLGWKIGIPAGVANVVITAALILFAGGD